MNAIRKSFYVVRELGPRFAWLRGRLAVRDRLGFTRRRFWHRSWDDVRVADVTVPGTPIEASPYADFKRRQGTIFLFPLGESPALPERIRSAPSRRSPPLPERIDLLRGGRCVLFGCLPSASRIDWHAQPLGAGRTDGRVPWYDIPDFDPSQGDARTLWEPSRASWAIDLARADAHGVEHQAHVLLLEWFRSWTVDNPPFLGFQWKNGQEAAIRLMSLAFGFWALDRADRIAPEDWFRLLKLAWATGYRIENQIEYALSQRNNHALSEAMGLILVGCLFSELRDATRWLALGRRIFQREFLRQVYPDGSYVQHSMNYHRVMLQIATLVLRLMEARGEPFSQESYDRLGKAAEFLYQLTDPKSGRVPRYGHDDGAWALPLCECPPDDFRPAAQAAFFLVHRTRLWPAGPWDEDLVWLFGAEACADIGSTGMEPAPFECVSGPGGREPARAEVRNSMRDGDRPLTRVTRQSARFAYGGYYVLRAADSWAMMRCHTYRDRPSHCDPLHVDLWWRGINVLQDCGTFCYYIPERPALEHYFKSIAAHNTVQVENSDPMEAVSRFLWLRWLRACVRHEYSNGPNGGYVEAEHYGYDRAPWGVLHRRAVLCLPDNVWVVVDDLFARKTCAVTLRWHLADSRVSVDESLRRVVLPAEWGTLSVGMGCDPPAIERFAVVRGQWNAEGPQGFAAPSYGQIAPIPTVEARACVFGALRLITVVCNGASAVAHTVSRSDQGQSWRVGPAEAPQTLELLPPDRKADGILRNSDSGDLGSSSNVS